MTALTAAAAHLHRAVDVIGQQVEQLDRCVHVQCVVRNGLGERLLRGMFTHSFAVLAYNLNKIRHQQLSNVYRATTCQLSDNK